ncbi:acetyl-CoA synthetase-like protein [Xylariaceae sp. FL1651]|nr:acetyl-CoA synthetase-like protein [Xylariaceae sp. FL1651]
MDVPLQFQLAKHEKIMWATDDLCPNIIRRLRTRTRPFVSVVSPDGQLEHLSVEDLHNASNRAAWFLSQSLEEDEEKCFYMGPNDVRYLIWILGAMKAGKCVICPSPNNTVSSNLRFFSTVGVTKLLYAPESSSSLTPLLEATNETITPILTPSYPEIISQEPVDDFPFPHTFEEVKDRPVMGLHTSGTSGHPKPIYWNHAAISSVAIPFDFSTLPNPPHRPHLLHEALQGNNVFLPFPLYHFGGIGMVLRTFLTDSTIVLPAPGTRLSPENFASMLKASSSTSTLTPPSILEAMLKSPCELEVISKLDHVAYSGGPLNPVLGEKLAKVIPHMFPLYGCTEGAGPYLESTGDNTYWNGMKFIDLGQRMEEVIPGLYELVITRTPLINRTQAYFHTCPHLEVFRTADLFAPIKGSDGWWTFHGRTDNWITMSNGLKMDPTEMENAISAHPDVTGVLVAGSHRFRLCLLVELRPESAPSNDEARERLVAELWPTIDKANKAAPKFGQIPRELIIFTSPDKPFGRAGKGTIQRRLSIAAYDGEIEDLYAKAEEGLLTNGLPPLKSTNPEDLLLFLRDLYSETLGIDQFTANDDVFAKGLDSLSIFLVAARIKAGLRKHSIPEEVLGRVNNALLFASTTVSKLAERLSIVLAERNGVDQSADFSSVSDVKNLLRRYEAEIPTILKNQTRESQTIVLTGSTGSLGSYILYSLLSQEDVKKVYCLNRAADAQAKQVSSFKAKGLAELPPERVRFLETNLAAPNLGLTQDDYASLAAETTTIVHNAYSVNFLMPVQSFEPQIQGLLNLLKLAQDGAHSPAIVFVSSIAAALPASGTRNVVKEAVLDVEDASSLMQQGYGQSKFICEKLVEKYVSMSKGKGAILRVGQVAGPLQGPGTWNVWEWAPSMILSSKYLGAAPESIGAASVDWIPVDELGKIISELVDDVARRENGGGVVYNVLNPTSTPWKELLPAVKEVIPETLPAAEWIARLEKSHDAGSRVLEQNPGVKLIDFYKQAFLVSDGKQPVVIDKHNLLWGSKTARELSPVKPEHLTKWMKGWGL